MSLLLAAQRAWTVPGWVKDPLWRRAQAIPSLDLRFADNKSLVDAVTGASLITFTRASSGTYVDSAGVLRTAVTNLLLRSEEFNDASWVKTRASASVNATTAPNGTTTADALIEDTTASASHIAYQNVNLGVAFHTISVYAKASTRTQCYLRIDTAASSRIVIFDLTTGTPTNSPGIVGSATSVGNDWYRCTATLTAAETCINAVIGLALAGNVAYTGNGTSGIYLWGAQLEQSATVGDYVPTTSTINSAPRFDHNPTTGESLGLLVEEARTNSIRNNTMVGAVVGTTYAYSVYVKPIGDRNFEIGYPPTIFTGRFARFSLSGSGSVQGTDAGVTASIQAAGNGWYRCSATSTCATGSGSRIGNFINNASFSRSYAGDTAAGLFIWGAQLEAGAFPTSYIPTTTAAATRSADVASITGTAFSSWYRQDEGTFYFSAKRDFAVPAGAFPRVFQVQAASGADKIEQSFYNAGQVCFVRTTAAVQAEWYPNYFVQNGVTSSFAIATNNIAGSSNGVITGTDNVAVLPTVDRMQIGAEGAAINHLNGTIRRLVYWGQRLPNNVLQAITQ